MSGRRWTAIPAANSDGTVLSVGFKVPAGRRVYFRATLSADAWCNTGASGVPGEGACSVRVVVNRNGNSMLPLTSDFGHVMVSDQDSQYAPTTVEFYTPRSYPSGAYTITAQASFSSGGGMNLETDLLTVDEIAAS